MRIVRILILMLFVPTALMPVRLDVCLDCLFGQEVCCETDTGPSCCSGQAETSEAPASCCSAPNPVEDPGFDRAPRDCCLHIDNARDEIPAPDFSMELPPALSLLTVATIQPAPRKFVAFLFDGTPDSRPPPETPLPLLI